MVHCACGMSMTSRAKSRPKDSSFVLMAAGANEESSYSFIHCCDRRSAELAIGTQYGRPLFGQPIKVNWAYASGQREDTSGHFNVFVGDLSPEVTDAMLFTCFSVYPSCSCCSKFKVQNLQNFEPLALIVYFLLLINCQPLLKELGHDNSCLCYDSSPTKSFSTDIYPTGSATKVSTILLLNLSCHSLKS